MKKELYKETGYPGIKQRISDNMYIVTIDLGRQLRLNKKTGLMEMKQAKTTKHVTTLKEAKALLGKNNKVKKCPSFVPLQNILHITRRTGRIPI